MLLAMFFTKASAFAFLRLPLVHGASGVSGMRLRRAPLPVETFRPHYSLTKELVGSPEDFPKASGSHTENDGGPEDIPQSLKPPHREQTTERTRLRQAMSAAP